MSLVILNYVSGYGGIVDRNNYIGYMQYVSMEFNICLYGLFVVVIGILVLNLYIKERFAVASEKLDNNEEKAV